MNGRRTIILRILAAVVVLSAVTVGILRWGGSEDGLTDTLFASGTVEATEADLSFRLPGRIAEVRAREGDRVTAGDLLASLETRELEANLSAAQAQLATARAQLAELERGSRAEEVRTAESAVRAARERWDETVREVERTRRLFEGGAVSRDALDRAETAERIAAEQHEQANERLALVREGPRAETVEAQRARVLQAEAAIEQAEATLEHARIMAPFGGVIAVRHGEPGETVGAGTPVLSLQNLDDRWVRIYIREDRIGRVRIGGHAEIRSDSDPERVFRGEVVHIGSEAEFTPRNVQTTEERLKLVYPVKVAVVEDPEEVLKPGVPADVTLLDPTGGSAP